MKPSGHVTRVYECEHSRSWYFSCTCGALQDVPVVGTRTWSQALLDSVAHAVDEHIPEATDTVVVDIPHAPS